jgi:hypothetical protein
MSSASASKFVGRILSRLERAEGHESNPHLQADYRIAWITVLGASRGERLPHVSASYAVLGLHPAKVWPAILGRRRALLGPLYCPACEDFCREPAPLKKPAQSERDPRPAERTACEPLRKKRTAR